MPKKIPKQRITQKKVLELLRYVPSTGKLYWKYRSLKWFEDTKRFSASMNQKRWNDRYAGKECFTSKDTDGYLIGKILGHIVKSHRIIWFMLYGYFPKQVDHKNGITGDNRKRNLREVDKFENAKNQKLAKNNKSTVIGVDYWPSQRRWVARISIKGKRKFLGYFGNFEDAVNARRRAEKKYKYHKNHGRRMEV